MENQPAGSPPAAYFSTTAVASSWRGDRKKNPRVQKSIVQCPFCLADSLWIAGMPIKYVDCNPGKFFRSPATASIFLPAAEHPTLHHPGCHPNIGDGSSGSIPAQRVANGKTQANILPPKLPNLLLMRDTRGERRAAGQGCQRAKCPCMITNKSSPGINNPSRTSVDSRLL